MAVAIERHHDGRVTEKLLDVLRVYSSAQEQGGARVPEIVQLDLGKPGSLQQGLEAATVHEVPGQRLARLRSEYKAVVLPKGTQPQPRLVLAFTVAPEGFYSLFG